MVKEKRPHPGPKSPKTLHDISQEGSGYTNRKVAKFKKNTPFTSSIDIELDKIEPIPENLKSVNVVLQDSPPEFAWYSSYTEWQEADIERYLTDIEAWATRILKEANINVKPAFSASALRIVEKMGFRPHKDIAWYAAVILKHATTLKGNISEARSFDPEILARCVAVAALQLAASMRDAEVAGISIKYGSQGGSEKRRLPPYPTLVRHLLRKNKNGTVRDLWNLIPTDMLDCIRIKGHKFYRRGERLIALGKVEGFKDWRPIGKSLNFRSFAKRVTQERKPRAH